MSDLLALAAVLAGTVIALLLLTHTVHDIPDCPGMAECSAGDTAVGPRASIVEHVGRRTEARIAALEASADMLRFLWNAETMHGSLVRDLFYDDDPLSADVPRILAALDRSGWRADSNGAGWMPCPGCGQSFIASSRGVARHVGFCKPAAALTGSTE